MTIDEAIKHAEEVAEEQIESAKIWERYPESKYEHHLARKAYNSCKECAEEHRQLAEWLKELKMYREIIPSASEVFLNKIRSDKK